MSEERGKVVKWIGGEVMGYRGSEVVVGWWDLPDNMSLKKRKVKVERNATVRHCPVIFQMSERTVSRILAIYATHPQKDPSKIWL